MKAALNGCLNLSVLDGWWDEWFQPDFGWAIPTADGAGTDPDHRDDIEAAALYDLLEQRITPRFYERGRAGLPDRWIQMVRRTLSCSARRCWPAAWSASTWTACTPPPPWPTAR